MVTWEVLGHPLRKHNEDKQLKKRERKDFDTLQWKDSLSIWIKPVTKKCIFF